MWSWPLGTSMRFETPGNPRFIRMGVPGWGWCKGRATGSMGKLRESMPSEPHPFGHPSPLSPWPSWMLKQTSVAAGQVVPSLSRVRQTSWWCTLAAIRDVPEAFPTCLPVHQESRTHPPKSNKDISAWFFHACCLQCVSWRSVLLQQLPGQQAARPLLSPGVTCQVCMSASPHCIFEGSA